MNADKLIRMANQIAGFFRSYPEAQAAAGIRDHITAFWTPRMRETLLSHLASGGDMLDPLVLKALEEFPQGRNGAMTKSAGAAGKE